MNQDPKSKAARNKRFEARMPRSGARGDRRTIPISWLLALSIRVKFPPMAAIGTRSRVSERFTRYPETGRATTGQILPDGVV
jgi:hypothetical protein